MSDIQAAPQSSLHPTFSRGNRGSFERGIAGDYDFSIGAILREAWEKTSGAKGTINLAAAAFLLLAVPLALLSIFFEEEGQDPGWRIQVAQQIVSALIGAPITAGLYMLGIRRSVGAPIRAGMVLDQFGNLIALFFVQILSTLMVMLGMLLLIVPGVYLAFGYMLAIPLVAEKGLGPWRALEASREAVGKHWFKAAGLGFSIGAINILGLLALGIGLFWTAPMSIVAYGIYYRTVFGVEPETVGAGSASSSALA